MKLKAHKVSRTGDTVTLETKWRDAMKRGAAIKLSLSRNVEDDYSEPAMVGDVRDVHGVLFGLAEVAWGLGWRPRGLMGRAAHLIESYKIPPEAK